MKATEAILAGVFAGGGSGGGGGGSMVVTVDSTWDSDLGDYVCTADKTVTEMYAAIQSGIIPVVKLTGDFTETTSQDINYLTLYYAVGGENSIYMNFSGQYISADDEQTSMSCAKAEFSRYDGADDIYLEYGTSAWSNT